MIPFFVVISSWNSKWLTTLFLCALKFSNLKSLTKCFLIEYKDGISLLNSFRERMPPKINIARVNWRFLPIWASEEDLSHKPAVISLEKIAWIELIGLTLLKKLGIISRGVAWLKRCLIHKGRFNHEHELFLIITETIYKLSSLIILLKIDLCWYFLHLCWLNSNIISCFLTSSSHWRQNGRVCRGVSMKRSHSLSFLLQPLF